VILDWDEDSTSCNSTSHAYGDPTDTKYRELYLDMLSHVASVLKQDSAIWRSLAYVKLSGANSRSAENRLPNGCKVEPGCICNNQRWAEAGYTPKGLYTFYNEQMFRINKEFPGKSMSYPLIQAGFPRVNKDGCYLNEEDKTICPTGINAKNAKMDGPFTQTETVITDALSTYGNGVAIAHLGIGPKPDFSDRTKYAEGTSCPLPLAPDGTLAHGPNGVASGCPNKWATDIGDVDGLTHFQTNNAGGVGNMAQIESALENMWANSNSAMLEIYEARAWEANDSILDPTLPPVQQRTLAQWNQRLHDRRRKNFSGLGDPTPTTISFTFTRSIDPHETLYYFVPKSEPRRPSPVSPKLGKINLLY